MPGGPAHQPGTCVIVLPWHDPIRVAEQIALLDVISGGRTLMGFGRGAPTVGYECYRIPMEEARPRFVELANLIIKLLSSDSFEWDGEFYKIPRMSIRPRREGDAGVAEGCRETAKQRSSFSLYRTKPSNSSCAQSCTSLID
jgi:alkanesulfonate monooxygenase SsuD/methylene tetrahydromethanopterin reductase-like flavin-dependent oxidoreductase (luciferase family)